MQPPLARHLLKTALPTPIPLLSLNALQAAVQLHAKALAAALLPVKVLHVPLHAKALVAALQKAAVPLLAKLPKL
ncbi:hypothetical protein [uncultured Erythrobacter sp.]|uniref:hypothetical protein n=1 Tax=uncultured Erythrobacter sp. TaxID=263913 RepID=UPI00260EDD85|nr:hypothetical protein [uncultured Erythrobacter sp.]